MFGWGKKPDLAEESDVFLSVHQALEGNFELVKPLSCQPPSTRRADDTYLLQHTEDQLESSLLSTETAGYNTARAADEQWFDTVKTVQSLEEDSDSDYNEAEPYPEEEEPAAAAVLPEKTKSVLIYQNSSGKFRRFKSDLAWAHNASDKNRNNCLDCAAQISCCDMTSEGGTTSAPNSMTVQTSYQERTTENFESSRLDQHSITEESTHSQSTIRDIRKSSISNNGCPSDCSFSKDSLTTDTGVAVMNTVDDLIQQLESLMVHDDCGDKNSGDSPASSKSSALAIPVCELSPNTKKEVHYILQETADSLEVNKISLDETQSSIELVRSLIAEAGMRYGFEDEDWPCKVASENLGNQEVNNCVNTHELTEQSPTKVFSPRAVAKHTDLVDKTSTDSSLSSEAGSKCASVPLCSNKENLSAANSKKAHSAGKTISSPEIKQNKPKPHSGRRKIAIENKDSSEICFSHAGRFAKDDRGDAATVNNRETEFNGDIVSRKSCHAPNPEDFVTCAQVLKENRGVRAKARYRRHRPIAKVLKKNSSDKKLPTVQQFKISSKTGAHSFFEILNAKISIPQLPCKKNITEATIPIHLHSEAIWHNGELQISIKDVDKELAHLPAEKKERFTRIPKTISIDFVREYKEDKLGQNSPCIVKKTIEKTSSPIKELQKMQQQVSPRRFNTKVDTIFRKDPLVLGTLDRTNLTNRKVIAKQKIKKTSIPAYCMV